MKKGGDARLDADALSRSVSARLADFVRLRGPLSGEPTARTLHVLLVGILAWVVFHVLILLPLSARKPANLALTFSIALSAVISLYTLRRGSLRKAGIIYVVSSWLIFSVVIVLLGGIRSPALVFYTALPISAGWLLGYRGALWTAAGCLVSALALAILETAGLGPYWYFPGVPFGLLTVVILAVLMAALPVSSVMKTLQDALAQARLTGETLRLKLDLLNRVMETSPGGILAVDRDGRIDFANARGAAVFGTTPQEINGRSFELAEWNITACDGLPLPCEQMPFMQVQTRREAIYGMPVAIQPGDKRVLLSINAAPLMNSAGEFDGAVVSVEDVTERRRNEEELLRHKQNLEALIAERTTQLVTALDQAQAANRAKTLFLARMSHELRTPLNAILGFSGLMRREAGVTARQTGALDIISRSGSHLLGLIDDILDISRIETGHAALEITSVDLIELAGDVIAMLRVQAEQKNLKLSLECSGVTVRRVRVDESKVRQILVNLVGNAIKYTEGGSVTLRVSTTQDAGKLRLRIEVQDTGIGITREEQARIFDPFVQLEHRNTRTGSGLGLAICRQFAQMMTGTIEVESTPGLGSTFRAELAAEVAPESQAPGAVEEIETIVAIQPDQPQFRILIIEDDLASGLLLTRLLEDAGFQTRIAEDGEAGICAFTAWHPHFIWLDIQLPGINGLEVATRIRELPGGHEVKMAALTASVFDEEREAILATGIDDFVRKPFRRGTVFESMERLLGVRYIRFVPAAKPGSGSRPRNLAEVARLPEHLRSELLKAVLLLDRERIIEVIRLVSVEDSALGSDLIRSSEAFEFTSILHAIQAGEPAR